jgi:cardiolipin synthase
MTPSSFNQEWLFFWGKILALCHLLGVINAILAIMRTRTAQGAIAWAIALITFPYLTVPLYWIFGRDRFHGYKLARQVQNRHLAAIMHAEREESKSQSSSYSTSSQDLPADLKTFKAMATGDASTHVFEKLAKMTFVGGNKASLCIDGQNTFAAIFRAIDGAKDYLLIQFFIIHSDGTGQEFKKRLLVAARRGVRIYFLFDEIGSHSLPRQYVEELCQHGIDMRSFRTVRGIKNRFQLNFRNHRKVVVSDGKVALIGGHNVGDEYLGKSTRFGHWRDTHVEVSGPAVDQVQIAFLEDWYWSSGTIPKLRWSTPPERDAEDKVKVLLLPSGPADPYETCSLAFLQAIHMAKNRLWLTSPYFVPDAAIMSALQLAVMRGVDVRVLIPAFPDHLMVYLAGYSFIKEALPFGVKLYRYQKGFIHQKVMLIDNHMATVGTANFDNRSFRLNFELTLFFSDPDFCHQVETMLEKDFEAGKIVSLEDIEQKPLLFKIAVQIARLLAPIL